MFSCKSPEAGQGNGGPLYHSWASHLRGSWGSQMLFSVLTAPRGGRQEMARTLAFHLPRLAAFVHLDDPLAVVCLAVPRPCEQARLNHSRLVLQSS
jgi:hypothetical protein